MNNEQQNNNFCNGLFAFNVLDIISLLIGLQNIELNVTAKDLDKQTHTILDEIHSHLQKQDERIERIEKLLLQAGNKE